MTEVVVVVPILGRPHHAQSFCESFRASTPEGRAVVLPVASGRDPVHGATWKATMDAWTAEGCSPLLAHGYTFAQKVNYAYEAVKLNQPEASWLLLVGSDVIFRPGWLQSALITAELTGAKVVATNDTHNPAVLAGTHATHPLVNRAWVEEHGASWEGPGSLCFEGYSHNFVDSELSTVAREAGVFAYAPLAVIEHRHPIWGDAVNDSTYELGQSTYMEDQALFMDRWRKYGKQAA